MIPLRRSALLALFLLCLAAVSAADFIVQTGETLPRFTARTVAGSDWSSGDAAPVTIIQVLAPESAVCRQMAPASQYLWEQVAPKGARMAVILRGADDAAARAFAESNGWTFPVIADPEGEKAAWFAELGKGVPRTLIAGPEGRVAYLHAGYRIGREAEFVRVAEALAEGRMMPSLGQAGPSAGRPQSEASMLGQKAPQLDVERWITREPGDLTGKYVMTEFWATWCGPCHEAMPYLQEWSKKYEGRLVIRSISDEPATDVSAFLRDTEFTYPLGTDSQRRTANRIGVYGIPFAFIQNPEGIVVWQGHPLELAISPTLLDEILAGKAPASSGARASKPAN
ncbi:MAG: hypothetical protein PWP23_797 [Candidatus Sumerlaeota bacterium]|nr:hypothetical protein [Candidatus Sumerlaeota bacterium]